MYKPITRDESSGKRIWITIEAIREQEDLRNGKDLIIYIRLRALEAKDRRGEETDKQSLAVLRIIKDAWDSVLQLFYFLACPISLQAWGYDDSTGRSGYIKVGGATVIDTTRTTTYTGRGFFIEVVNLATCSASGYTNYDTYGSAAAATTLANYLKGLSANTIIVCATADSENVAANNNHLAAVCRGEMVCCGNGVRKLRPVFIRHDTCLLLDISSLQV